MRNKEETIEYLIARRGFDASEISRLEERVAPMLTTCDIWLRADGFFLQDIRIKDNPYLFAIVGDTIILGSEG